MNTLKAPETKFETSGKPPSLASTDPTRPEVAEKLIDTASSQKVNNHFTEKLNINISSVIQVFRETNSNVFSEAINRIQYATDETHSEKDFFYKS